MWHQSPCRAPELYHDQHLPNRKDCVVNLKDKIKQSKLKAIIVIVPEWDVVVEVRELTAAQRNAILLKTSKNKETGGDEFQRGILVASIYDPENGEPVFTPDDLTWLFEKSAAVCDMLVKRAMDISGIGIDAVEEDEKN